MQSTPNMASPPGLFPAQPGSNPSALSSGIPPGTPQGPAATSEQGVMGACSRRCNTNGCMRYTVGSAPYCRTCHSHALVIVKAQAAKTPQEPHPGACAGLASKNTPPGLSASFWSPGIARPNSLPSRPNPQMPVRQNIRASAKHFLRKESVSSGTVEDDEARGAPVPQLFESAVRLSAGPIRNGKMESVGVQCQLDTSNTPQDKTLVHNGEERVIDPAPELTPSPGSDAPAKSRIRLKGAWTMLPRKENAHHQPDRSPNKTKQQVYQGKRTYAAKTPTSKQGWRRPEDWGPPRTPSPGRARHPHRGRWEPYDRRGERPARYEREHQHNERQRASANYVKATGRRDINRYPEERRRVQRGDAREYN